MPPASLEHQVCDTISHELGVPRQRVTRDSHMSDDLGADSLDMMELILMLEDQFEVDIPTDTARTVGELVDIIEREKSK